MSVSDIHERAMELADEALAAKRRGHTDESRRLFSEALDYERRAAEMVVPDLAAEPTRSVLLRSAASLAAECGEWREAERLVAIALSGNPPVEIAEELRDLWERIHREFRKPAELVAA
jgi:hypothetical protein